MKNHEGFCVLSTFNPLMQRQDMREEKSQMKTDIPRVWPEGGQVPMDVQTAIQRTCGGGQQLEGALQKQMSATLGHDFRKVRVHIGREADKLSHRLGARAFTIGQDIFFERDAYDPGTLEGRKLIAHELIHIAQQGATRNSIAAFRMTVSPASDPLEQEAETLAAIATTQPARFRYKALAVRLRTHLPAPIYRTLATVCQVAAPGAAGGSCHTATLWWIYRSRHGAASTPLAFANALGNNTPNEMIADMLKKYGYMTANSAKSPFTAQPGTVVVFAKGKDKVNIQNGHSCVYGMANQLYGHSQWQGWFGTYCSGGANRRATCPAHSGAGHCHHPIADINWSAANSSKVTATGGNFNVYTVTNVYVTKWANKRNF